MTTRYDKKRNQDIIELGHVGVDDYIDPQNKLQTIVGSALQGDPRKRILEIVPKILKYKRIEKVIKGGKDVSKYNR